MTDNKTIGNKLKVTDFIIRLDYQLKVIKKIKEISNRGENIKEALISLREELEAKKRKKPIEYQKYDMAIELVENCLKVLK